MATAAELRELDDEELESRLSEYRRDLLNLRFQLATGQLDNAARLGQVRRDVARVLTVLRDREIALAEGRPVTPAPIAAAAPRRTRARRAPVEEPADEVAPAYEEDEVVAAEDEAADVEPSAPVEEDAASEEAAPGTEEPEEARGAKRSGLRRRRGRAAKAEAADEAEDSAEDAADAAVEEE